MSANETAPALPPLFDDSDWKVVRSCYDPKENAYYESLFGLSNGRIGLRPSVDFSAIGQPGFFHADAYGSAITVPSHLLNVFNPTFRYLTVGGLPATLDSAVEFAEELDLRQARVTLLATLCDQRGLRTRLRVDMFLPAQYEDVVATRIEATPLGHRADIVVTTGIDWSPGNGDFGGTHSRVRLHHLEPSACQYAPGGLFVASPTPPAGSRVVTAAQVFADVASSDRAVVRQPRRLAEALLQRGGTQRSLVITQLAVVRAGNDEHVDDSARTRLAEISAVGYEELADRHARTWEDRWAQGPEVTGAPEAVEGLRYAQFQLLQSVDRTRRVTNQAARGLTSEYHSGHVFFNSEFFVLPYLTYVEPEVAKAMIRFRLETLDAAVAYARDTGYAGARFPEEVDNRGRPSSPHVIKDVFADETYTENSGIHVKHLSADVLHALATYLKVTGDEAFLRDEALPLVVQSAIYLADLMRPDPRVGGRGACHVMGFDEYHYDVDHSFGTNLLAKWALRWAADAMAPHAEAACVAPAELDRWRQVADEVYLPPSQQGVVPVFEGYFGLPDQLRQDSPGHRLPKLTDADAERAHYLRRFSTQLVKQADVVFAMSLVPEWFSDEVLAANLGYYEPRTVHESSLSMTPHAVAAARLGQSHLATELMLASARYNLDFTPREDYENGVHLAACAGAWLVIYHGFLGVQVAGDILSLAPSLPEGVTCLRVALRVFGQVLTIMAQAAGLTVTANPHNSDTVRVRLGLEEFALEPGDSRDLPMDCMAAMATPQGSERKRS